MKSILYLGERRGKSFPRKNLAKERMQRLRKDLSIDKEKVKEVCNADLVSRKAPQRLSRTLPDSSGRYIKYFMYILHFLYFTLSLINSQNICLYFLAFLHCSVFIDNNTLGSTCTYRNVETRLKRLRNRILKDAVYERNVTLNGNKSQSQQSKEPDTKHMTKDKLIEQGKQEVLYEEMDWEPMNDEEIALEVLSI